MKEQFQNIKEAIISRIDYDPLTGIFRWKQSAKNHRKGMIAGSKTGPRNHKQLYISVLRKKYPNSRVAWLIMTGSFPPNLIDHIDRNPLNNVWTNLRSATHAGNAMNSSLRRDNKSGIKGVIWSKCASKWAASIRANGKQYHLGTFENKVDAGEAYRKASLRLHGEFSSPVSINTPQALGR